MYYSININQIAIATFNKSKETIKLDLIDGCIMEYLQKQSTSRFAKKNFLITEDNEIFFLICYDNIIKQLPLLNIETKDAIGRRIKKLKQANIINHFIDRKNNNKVYFNTTDLFETFFSYDQTDEKPNPNGLQTERLTDEKPNHNIYDKNIKDKNINDKEKNIKKEKPFIKPSREEVQEYIVQESLSINANSVMSYYDKQNWVKKNGQPVVNWKSTIKNWNRPTIDERNKQVESISFEVKEKSENYTAYKKLQTLFTEKGNNRTDIQIKKIIQTEEIQEWLQQAQHNKTFEATVQDIQNNQEAKDVLKTAYIAFLERFRTSKEQVDNDIKNCLPLFLTRCECEEIKYIAILEGLNAITKKQYNDYRDKQIESKTFAVSHYDYIFNRIKAIDDGIKRYLDKLEILNN